MPRRRAVALAVLLATDFSLLAIALPMSTVTASVPSTPPSTDLVKVEVTQVDTLSPGQARTAQVKVQLCSTSGGAVSGARQVALSAPDRPGWLQVAFDPPTYTFAVLLPGECEEARGTARFNASRNAPAFEFGRFHVVAEDTRGGVRQSVEYVVRVGYFGDLRVSPETDRLDAPLGAVVGMRVSVENRGNALTRFQLRTAGVRDDVKVAYPEPLLLKPGERGEFTVRFILPVEAGHETRTVDLLVTSHAHFDHEEKGGSERFRVTLVPQGVSAAGKMRHFAPAIGDFAMFGAIAGLAIGIAWWQARRR